jgi:uncharacterized protein DUF6885
MSGSEQLEMRLLPGALALLRFHAQELPQRDDLCGAFCGALALRAAGIEAHTDAPLDQDAVALAAGSIVSGARDPGTLPHGEPGRRDYRLQIPSIDDPERSGTTAGGLLDALNALAGGALVSIPYAGPWTAATLDGLFDLAAALEHPATLLANLATHHLWGGNATAAQLLGYLLSGDHASGPPPDWDVGHFACVVGCAHGPGGRLYGVADTYPALGNRGVHLQPRERLATAIAREDKPAGGVIAVVAAEDAAVFRAGAAELGLSEGLWDNGTVTAGVAG